MKTEIVKSVGLTKEQHTVVKNLAMWTMFFTNKEMTYGEVVAKACVSALSALKTQITWTPEMRERAREFFGFEPTV